MQQSPVIELLEVRKTFQTTIAVDHLNLSITPGQIFGFLGPNGAGKTTTIRMLTGILLQDTGSIQLFGMNFMEKRREILNQIGYIPDRAYLYPKLTGMELLYFLGSLRKMSRIEVKKKADYYLELFELQDKAGDLIERYSHGMKQKLVLTTALMHSPQLIIVDEPMVGLDPRAARKIKTLFQELASQGKTVFMSTHSLDIAEELCNQVGIINKGKMAALDTPKNLMKRLKSADDSAQDTDLEAIFLALTEEEVL